MFLEHKKFLNVINGQEPFHQSSLSLFHQNKNFDVKVNSTADKPSNQKAIFFVT